MNGWPSSASQNARMAAWPTSGFSYGGPPYPAASGDSRATPSTSPSRHTRS
ncbi:hypothetical protein GCM10009558_104380 [Virgisporangium aurantiacum]